MKPQNITKSGKNNGSRNLALFLPLTGEQSRILDLFPKILEKVWPLTKSRRDFLPYDIRELSRVLAGERGD
ncbi:MAG: hypothetical protein K2H64_10990, partial [Desulfovibrio sp.]|nr:hypothetical protein [Desulfovibrio sp.]